MSMELRAESMEHGAEGGGIQGKTEKMQFFCRSPLCTYHFLPCLNNISFSFFVRLS